jgi:2-keto-4-pentenoate hydratase/2-oxohepta-3-ene-1,7-dioic acid hydratase in catechol pathway
VKLATFRLPGSGETRGGEVRGQEVRPFVAGLTVAEVLGGAEPRVDPGSSPVPLGDVTLLAPVPAPGAIYGIGLNYAAHGAETGRGVPEQPMVFVKVAGSVAPPGGAIRRPEVVRRLDYEGELAIVIGAGGGIGGYCVADDVSARDLQKREQQWTRAKGADTFCPFGPWVTTADELGGDPGRIDLQLRTWVNGELRQDARTCDLVFGPRELVAFISQTCTLRPGDLILTGTPSGVGMALDPPRFLQSGDVIRIEIERLGAIEHAVA